MGGHGWYLWGVRIDGDSGKLGLGGGIVNHAKARLYESTAQSVA